MKDDKLEKQFDEYFKGVNTPDNITGDAKKYVAKSSAFLPKFLKFACASASIALVLAVSLTLFIGRRNNSGSPADPPAAESNIYYDTSLIAGKADAYNIYELDPSLKFISRLAYSDSASVNDCTAYYGADNTLSLVKADVNTVIGLNSYKSEIYVEFEEGVYYAFKDYVNGTAGTYRGVEYFVTRETAENGEPLFKLHFKYGGLKYYCNITSSDEDACKKYIDIILKK